MLKIRMESAPREYHATHSPYFTSALGKLAVSDEVTLRTVAYVAAGVGCVSAAPLDAAYVSAAARGSGFGLSASARWRVQSCHPPITKSNILAVPPPERQHYTISAPSVSNHVTVNYGLCSGRNLRGAIWGCARGQSPPVDFDGMGTRDCRCTYTDLLTFLHEGFGFPTRRVWVSYT